MKNFLAVIFLCLFSTVAFAQINVVSTLPADGAFNVDTDSVVITFDKKIKLDENNPEEIESIIILPFDSLTFNGINMSEDGKTLTFYVDLKPNTDFTGLVINVEGENGEQMETPHLFRFSTYPTLGEFTVDGFLSSGDLVALKAEVSNQQIVIALLPDKNFFDEGMDDEPNINYATLLTDYDNLTFNLPNIREGVYYPVAFIIDDEDEDGFAIYVYDLDDNLQTPDSIVVNATTAPTGILSGIELHQLKEEPITFSESFAKSIEISDQLGSDYTLLQIESYNRLTPNTATHILNGKAYNWEYYYLNTTNDEVYRVDISSLFIEHRSDDHRFFDHLPGGISPSDLMPISSYPDIIHSDAVLQIAEDNGGTSYRSDFENDPSFRVDINIGLTHEYGLHVAHLTQYVPISWVVNYYVMQHNDYFDSFRIFIDPETGEVLQGYTQRYKVEGSLVGNTSEIIPQNIRVVLNRKPPKLNVDGTIDNFNGYELFTDQGQFSYKFDHIEEGIYYPIAVVNQNNPPPTYYVYNLDNDSSTPDSIVVSSETTTFRTLSNIDLKQWKPSEPVGIFSDNDLPDKTSLLQNYPNPFNPTTNISFTLNKPGQVELSIYNALGQKVATLIDRNYQAGMHTMQWDATQFSSGIYLYKLTANGISQTRKLLLIK